MMQTRLTDHFDQDEEKTAVELKIKQEGFADHFLDELERKFNWHEDTIPWSHLHKYHMYCQALAEKQFMYPELVSAPFEFRDVGDIVEDFFHSTKPKGKFLGQYVEYWILYFVTEGRYRTNHNKVTRVFKHTRGDLKWMLWSTILKNSPVSAWETVHCDRSYNLILEITEMCNAVLAAIRRRLRRTTLNTNYRKSLYTNLQNLPEFCPFQNNRTPGHKQFRWYFEQRKKGGNGGLHKKPKAERFPKHSVHGMLREYYEWMPKIRKHNVKRKKTDSSDRRARGAPRSNQNTRRDRIRTPDPTSSHHPPQPPSVSSTPDHTPLDQPPSELRVIRV